MDSDSSSLTTMPSLPQELITDVLSRLPVKPLLRFKCVSKSWLALISSREFAKTHLSVAANNKDCSHHRFVLTFENKESYKQNLKDCSLSSFLNNDSLTEAVDLDFPMMEPQKCFRVVGSVNGIICLHLQNDLFMWNPSIKKFKKLPDFKPSQLEDSRGLPQLSYGFGYDKLRDDYKVLGSCYCFHGYERTLHHHEVKIYSVKSDSWRKTSDFPSGMHFCFRSNTFVNGKLLWLGYAVGSRIVADERVIISFDLTDEKWAKVEQPSYGGEGYHVSYPLGLGSDLSIICAYPGTHADVWVMKEYGVKESWTKVYTIKYPIDPKQDFFPGISSVLRISNRGILLVSWSTFMIYNPDDESIKTFEYPNVTNVNKLIVADIYIESLVCPLLQVEPEQE